MPEVKYPNGIAVCVPVFNDWVAVRQLIANMRDVIRPLASTRIVVVDDGSIDRDSAGKLSELAAEGFDIDVLELVRNVGHQRAIAIGLAAIESRIECDIVVVIDGDGEDNPAQIPDLLAEVDGKETPSVVMARRSRRAEGFLFRIGYQCFKVLHRALTGKACDVGNFSVVPARWLKALVHSPELWNHYAATVIASRIPTRKVDCPRASRYAGRSKMNLTALVVHGLRAISVFGETVGVRVGIALGFLTVAAVAGMVTVITIRLGTDLAIPGWATNASGLLLILTVNLLILTAMSLMFLLGARSTSEFIPARDWSLFVNRWRHLND